jgi:hypothetical protein
VHLLVLARKFKYPFTDRYGNTLNLYMALKNKMLHVTIREHSLI